MPTYIYDRIAAMGYKRGPCAVCGKTAERSQTFSQTVNPFNKNPDGSVKTAGEIWSEVNKEARTWERGDVFHKRCEWAQ